MAVENLCNWRIRKIKGLLALPWLHLSSALGAGKAGQARGGERRRDALGDSRVGKSMAKQEGPHAAVGATPSRHARGARYSLNHGVGHFLLLLYNAKAPRDKNSNYFNAL